MAGMVQAVLDAADSGEQPDDIEAWPEHAASVTTYRGADSAGIEQALDAWTSRIEDQLESPPEGLEGIREVTVLVDRENGRAQVIVMFETEEDLRRGDKALSHVSMSQAGGVRTDVESHEIALHRGRSS